VTEPRPAQSATLVIWGGDFDPEEVTRRTGWQPSQAWRKGGRKSRVRADGSVQFFNTRHEWSGWKLWLEDDWRREPLAEQIGHWAELLEEHSELLRGLREQDASVEINCCVVTSRSTVVRVPAELQAQLGQLGVDLDITLYPRGPSEGAV
jgi:hypothetical protein